MRSRRFLCLFVVAALTSCARRPPPRLATTANLVATASTPCSPWVLADACAALVQSGRVPEARRLLDRVATFMAPFRAKPFRAKEGSARIEMTLGNRAVARAELVEARRLLGREKQTPPHVRERFARRLDNGLADLDEP